MLPKDSLQKSKTRYEQEKNYPFKNAPIALIVIDIAAETLAPILPSDALNFFSSPIS